MAEPGASEDPSGGLPFDPAWLVPHPERLPPDRPDYVRVLELHRQALTAGEAGYIDPASGLFALTARTLWERGTCCGSGCRHCPWVGRS